MRFEFCGNIDCPEWVLSEVAILNKMSAIKLKLMLAQFAKFKEYHLNPELIFNFIPNIHKNPSILELNLDSR